MTEEKTYSKSLLSQFQHSNKGFSYVEATLLPHSILPLSPTFSLLLLPLIFAETSIFLSDSSPSFRPLSLLFPLSSSQIQNKRRKIPFSQDLFVQMGFCRRHRGLQLLGFALVVLVLGQGHGSSATRNSNVFKVKRQPISSNNNINPQNPNHFLNFLPKGLPFPYSGPSRKHNGIGLESWSRDPSSSPP